MSTNIDLSEVFTFHPGFSSLSIFMFYVRKFKIPLFSIQQSLSRVGSEQEMVMKGSRKQEGGQDL